MRICQVIASKGEGGLEKHVRELSVQLTKAGHEVVVFGDEKFLAPLSVELETVSVHFERSRHNPLLLIELLCKLRQCRCDLIHAQANKAVVLVGKLKQLLKRPVVGTLHNLKRNTQMYRRMDHVIAVSRQSAHLLDHPKVTVVCNGIEPPQVKILDLRAAFDLPLDQPVLCAVGRLVKAKGFDFLLDAIDGLPTSLLIVGDGPERTSLARRVAHLHPPTVCRLTGYQPNVPSLLASADAMIISSRREGFPYVLIEALFAGVPMLSTDVSGINEFLPDKLVVGVDNVGQLHNRLSELLQSFPQWQALMEKPCQFARQRLTLHAMMSSTVEVYKQTLVAYGFSE